MVEISYICLKWRIFIPWLLKLKNLRQIWKTQSSNWHPLICTYIEDAIVHCPTSLSNFPLRQKPTYLHYFPLLLLGNWSKKSFFHRWFPVLLNSLRHTTCWVDSFQDLNFWFRFKANTTLWLFSLFFIYMFYQNSEMSSKQLGTISENKLHQNMW